MDDPVNNPDLSPSELKPDTASGPDQAIRNPPAQEFSREITFPLSPALAPADDSTIPFVASGIQAEFDSRAEIHRRSFLNNLYVLLPLCLAAFTLTVWILIRMDSPFGIFSSGPQEIVRAQLLALDRGDLRPAYDMFSARYRAQVSFDDWHRLIVTHMRMFHAEVERSEVPSSQGPGISLELFLHGDDDRDYRARFTLIHVGGRWWIDDVHWTQEPDQRDVLRT